VPTLQVEPPSAEKNASKSPTATQSLVEAHDTELRGPDPLGKVPALQVEPPSVDWRTCAASLLASPTATQSLVEAQDTDLRLYKPPGSVLALQVEPLSVE
jgi:hypothetical protein